MTPNFDSLQKAIKSIAPERADDMMGKYTSVMESISLSLMAPDTEEIATDSSDHLNRLASELVELSEAQVSDQTLEERKLLLLENFERELDLISVALPLNEPALAEETIADENFFKAGQEIREGASVISGLHEELKELIVGDEIDPDYAEVANALRDLYLEWDSGYQVFKAAMLGQFGDTVTVSTDDLGKLWQETEGYSLEIDAMQESVEKVMGFVNLNDKFEKFMSEQVEAEASSPELSQEHNMKLYQWLKAFKDDFEGFEGLPDEFEGVREQQLDIVEWNLELVTPPFAKDKPDFMSAADLEAEVKALSEEEVGPDSSVDFEARLGWVLSNVVFVPEELNPPLPTNVEFYESLIVLVEQQVTNLKSTVSKEKELLLSDAAMKVAQYKIVLSHLNRLAVKAQYFSGYKEGDIIWISEFHDDSVRDTSYEARDQVGPTDQFAHDSDGYRTDRVYGVVEKVDFWSGTLKLKGSDEVHGLDDFTYHDTEGRGGDRYYFGTDAQAGEVPIAVSCGIDRIRELEANSRREVEGAKWYTLQASVLELGANVVVSSNHIPKYSILRKYIEKGWAKLADVSMPSTLADWASLNVKGRMTMSDACPRDRLEDVYQAVLAQFQIEQVFKEQNDLITNVEGNNDKDKFLNERLLFMQLRTDLALGDLYSARAHAVDFVDFYEKNAETPDEGIVAAKDFVVSTLRGFALQSLGKMQQVAASLFGMNPDWKDFAEKVNARIEAETERIKGIDVSGDAKLTREAFDIKPENLVASQWRNEYRPTIGRYGQRDERVGVSGGLLSDEIKGFDDQKAEAYLKKHYPTQGLTDVWNEVIGHESPSNYKSFLDPDFRSKKCRALASKLRKVEGYDRSLGPRGHRKQEESYINPEAAHVYYQEALGPEIAQAKFELAERRERLLEIEKRNRHKYEAKARTYLQEQLKSAELKREFVGEGGMQSDEYDKIVAQLGDEKVIAKLTDQFLDSYVDEKLNKIVYSKFGDGALEGSTNAEGIWKEVNSMLDPNDEWLTFSDRGVEQAWEISKVIAKELLIAAVITAVSFGVATVATTGARLAVVASGIASRTWALSRTAVTAGKYAAFVFEGTTFLVAQKSIEHAFLGRNTWDTFGSDLRMTLLMLGSLRVGQFLWHAKAGKGLVGTSAKGMNVFDHVPKLGTPGFVPSPLYANAGKWGKLGLRLADYSGQLGTELGIFTATSVAHELSAGKDVNLGEQLGMNLLTIMALRTGSKVVSPLIQPINAKIEVRRTRMLEDRNHDTFLSNRGLDKAIFEQATSKVARPEADANAEVQAQYKARILEVEKATMDNIRSFEDNFRLPSTIFKGRTPEEIDAIIKAVYEVQPAGKVSKPPTPDVLVRLASEQPLVFQIVTNRMRRIGLTIPQIGEIAKTNGGPELLRAVGRKLRVSKSRLEEIIKDPAKAVEVARRSEVFLPRGPEVLHPVTAEEVAASRGTGKGKGLLAKLRTLRGRFNAATVGMSLYLSLGAASLGGRAVDYFERPGIVQMYTEGRESMAGEFGKLPEAKPETPFVIFGEPAAVKPVVEAAKEANVPVTVATAAEAPRAFDRAKAEELFKGDADLSQKEIFRKMEVAGFKPAQISDFAKFYSQIPDELKEYVRVFGTLAADGEATPYFVFNQEKINADLGVSLVDLMKAFEGVDLNDPKEIADIFGFDLSPEAAFAFGYGGFDNVQVLQAGVFDLVPIIGTGAWALLTWPLKVLWGAIHLLGSGLLWLAGRSISNRLEARRIRRVAGIGSSAPGTPPGVPPTAPPTPEAPPVPTVKLTSGDLPSQEASLKSIAEKFPDPLAKLSIDERSKFDTFRGIAEETVLPFQHTSKEAGVAQFNSLMKFKYWSLRSGKLFGELRAKEVEIQTTETEIARVDAEISRVGGEILAIDTRVAEIDARIAEIVARIGIITTPAGRARPTFGIEKGDLEREWQGLELEKTRKLTEKTTLSGEKSTLQTEKAGFETEKTRIEGEKMPIQQELDAIKPEVEGVMDAIMKSERSIAGITKAAQKDMIKFVESAAFADQLVAEGYSTAEVKDAVKFVKKYVDLVRKHKPAENHKKIKVLTPLLKALEPAFLRAKNVIFEADGTTRKPRPTDPEALMKYEMAENVVTRYKSKQQELTDARDAVSNWKTAKAALGKIKPSWKTALKIAALGGAGFGLVYWLTRDEKSGDSAPPPPDLVAAGESEVVTDYEEGEKTERDGLANEVNSKIQGEYPSKLIAKAEDLLKTSSAGITAATKSDIETKIQELKKVQEKVGADFTKEITPKCIELEDLLTKARAEIKAYVPPVPARKAGAAGAAGAGATKAAPAKAKVLELPSDMKGFGGVAPQVGTQSAQPGAQRVTADQVKQLPKR